MPNMNSSPTFAQLLQQFFMERLIQQRTVSPRTVAAYRDTMRLLLPCGDKPLESPLQVAAHHLLEMRSRERVALEFCLRWKTKPQVDEYHVLAVVRYLIQRGAQTAADRRNERVWEERQESQNPTSRQCPSVFMLLPSR